MKKKVKKKDRTELTDEILKESLIKSNGIVLRASSYLNQHYGIVIDRRMLRDEIDIRNLNEFLYSCRRVMNDLAFCSLQDNIEKGEAWAISLQLKTQGHHDGFMYGETEQMVKAQYAKDAMKETHDKLDHLSNMLDELDGKTKDMTLDSPYNDTQEGTSVPS